ncbi:MAG: regulatory signaling modulator protein AmpE, partial [Salinisphaera sp.]|nr:regulatory signaling modulator protein AmpE [Salinisphaera sp.]
MNLILILLALAGERGLSHVRRWRAHDWYGRYLARARRVPRLQPLWRSPWGLLLLAPPLVAIGLLQGLLHGGAWTLVGWLFALVVLVFALGPRDLWEQVHRIIAAKEQGRDQDAATLAAGLATVAPEPTANADDPVAATLLQAHERVFGVILWFFVLGPLGALGYRMVATSPRHFRQLGAGDVLSDAASRLHGLAAWVPQRLTALLFGMAGSSENALKGWRAARQGGALPWALHGWVYLAASARGALQLEPLSAQLGTR